MNVVSSLQDHSGVGWSCAVLLLIYVCLCFSHGRLVFACSHFKQVNTVRDNPLGSVQCTCGNCACPPPGSGISLFTNQKPIGEASLARPYIGVDLVPVGTHTGTTKWCTMAAWTHTAFPLCRSITRPPRDTTTISMVITESRVCKGVLPRANYKRIAITPSTVAS